MGQRIRAVAVFCGSRTGADPAFEQAAGAFGRMLAERGVRLVYGGGGIGLMGALARAVLHHGGRITGVIPGFLAELELQQPDLTELVVVDDMHERKRCMFERADAFVILPGGLGTIDEAMEIITWKQLLLHAKPIVAVNTAGYWNSLAGLIDEAIDNGFADPKVRELFALVDKVDDVFAALDSATSPDPVVLTSHL